MSAESEDGHDSKNKFAKSCVRNCYEIVERCVAEAVRVWQCFSTICEGELLTNCFGDKFHMATAPLKRLLEFVIVFLITGSCVRVCCLCCVCVLTVNSYASRCRGSAVALNESPFCVTVCGWCGLGVMVGAIVSGMATGDRDRL